MHLRLTGMAGSRGPANVERPSQGSLIGLDIHKILQAVLMSVAFSQTREFLRGDSSANIVENRSRGMTRWSAISEMDRLVLWQEETKRLDLGGTSRGWLAALFVVPLYF